MKKWLTTVAVLSLTGLLSMNVSVDIQAQEKSAEASGSGFSLEQREDIEELITFIKEKEAAGELETQEDIRNVIEEGEEKFSVSLSEEETVKIEKAINRIKGLGLSSEYIISQAEGLYDKYGAELVNHADEAISEAVSHAVSNAAEGFFQSMKRSVEGFFEGLFEK